MAAQNFTAAFIVDQTPQEVYQAINDVRGWWSQDFNGASEKEGDVFAVNFNDMHWSQHQLKEMIPDKKVVWLVTDSRLNFLKDKTEWNGTENIFEISEENGKTKLQFTHAGLVPEIECFGDCSKGWTHFLKSLHQLITTGKGNPHTINKTEILK